MQFEIFIKGQRSEMSATYFFLPEGIQFEYLTLGLQCLASQLLCSLN